jgi:hypothetical protein
VSRLTSGPRMQRFRRPLYKLRLPSTPEWACNPCVTQDPRKRPGVQFSELRHAARGAGARRAPYECNPGATRSRPNGPNASSSGYDSPRESQGIDHGDARTQARPAHNCFGHFYLACREQPHHYGPDETLWRSVAANTAGTASGDEQKANVIGWTRRGAFGRARSAFRVRPAFGTRLR